MSTLEAKVYIRQDDGTLKPVEIEERLARKVAAYRVLRDAGMSLDEIRFVVDAALA